VSFTGERIHGIFIPKWFFCNRRRRYSRLIPLQTSSLLLRRRRVRTPWQCSMKFIVEIPDCEVFDAAEQPEDLACEIAELIATEIFSFSTVTVIPLQPPEGTLPTFRS
jgi:hypothetical protein